MKILQIVLAVVGAFLVQTLGARHLWPVASYLDLFLVTAAGFGLVHGRLTGLVAGTAAGLVQDAFSGGFLGLNGLSKTTVGYLAGIAGRRLILRGWSGRMVFFAVATAVDVLILTLVGGAVDKTVLAGDIQAAGYLCLGNGLVGTAILTALDKVKQRGST